VSDRDEDFQTARPPRSRADSDFAPPSAFGIQPLAVRRLNRSRHLPKHIENPACARSSRRRHPIHFARNALILADSARRASSIASASALAVLSESIRFAL
jgi:hypothetical protein